VTQLTIRFDEPLEREIDRLAAREGLSRNQAVVRLLRRGAGLVDEGASADEIGASLDHLSGTWSADEARAMAELEEDFERLEPDLWR
jgi:hypothetical protein